MMKFTAEMARKFYWANFLYRKNKMEKEAIKLLKNYKKGVEAGIKFKARNGENEHYFICESTYEFRDYREKIIRELIIYIKDGGYVVERTNNWTLHIKW